MNSPSRPWFVVAVATAIFTSPLTPSRAAPEELRGADAILREYSQLQAAETPAPQAGAAVPGDLAAQDKKLAADIARFGSSTRSGPQPAAAAAWLDLLDRWVTLASPPAPPAHPAKPPGFRTLVLNLPAPETWGVIADHLEQAHAERSLQMQLLLGTFAALLRNDDKALLKYVEALRALSGNPAEYLVSEVESSLLADTGDPAVAAELFRAQSMGNNTNGATLEVPDLVAVCSEETATTLLREALAQSIALDVSHAGDRTTALARKLALEMMDLLKVPQWGLTLDLDSAALFTALKQRFAGAEINNNGNSFAEASTFYLLGLIAHGQIDEAVACARAAKTGSGYYQNYLPYDAVHVLRSAGKSKEIFEFLNRLITADPTLPNWHEYVSLAADENKLDDVVALAENAARHPDLPATARREIGSRLAEAYLAADRIDDGVRELRAAMAIVPAQGQSGGMTDPVDLALKLAMVGQVLHRPDLVDEGVAAARKMLAPPPSAKKTGGQSSPYSVRELAEVLEKAGRLAEAEDVLRVQLLADGRYQLEQRREIEEQAAKQRQNASYFRYKMSNNDGLTRTDLESLAGLYSRQHRPADVVALLDHSTAWHEADLGPLLTSSDWSEAPLGYMAAQALADLGRPDDARRILTALLDTGSGYDPAYELFLNLNSPEDAVVEFDRLFARDRFQERPLIWKAEALGREGRAEEAEAAARAAIAVDPSDGEEGRGLRMRAYTTLADILAASGKDPEPYRSAVRAIRLSEDADQFYRAGLLSRAIPMYQQALDIFSGAYCIQSRLAVQLVALGQTEEAEKHYQRAFELMPTSFGRVESHCFGCEGVFNGPEAQGVADRVFTRLAGETPPKPQVFYLLGYLRFEEQRYAESLEATKRAVALDPDYLNAWKRIEDDLSDHLHVPRADLDASLLNILRLDPNRRHSYNSFGEVRDLAGLWKTAAEVQPLLAPTHPVCYPLAASQAEEKKDHATPASSRVGGTDAEGGDDDDTDNNQTFGRVKQVIKPSALVGNQHLMTPLTRALDEAARETNR